MISFLEIFQSAFSLIKQLDNTLMLLMNRVWIHPFFDQLALWMRESVFHIPLYVFLIIIAFQFFEKKALWWLLGAIALIAFTDLLSSQVIKHIFNRVRPCRDPFLAGHIRFLAKYCGSNPSFTSSHAFNHFALAAYTIHSFKNVSKWFILLYVWAAVIAYSQVYVGVHYPSDVGAGALLGMFFGWIGFKITNQAVSLHEPRI